MNTLATIAAIAAGRPTRALLQDARLSGFGIEAFGRAAILEFFRNAPFELASPRAVVESENAVAVHAGDIAVHADLYGGAVHRLWLLAPTGVAALQPRVVSVPSDPDGTQLVDVLLFRPEDHPELSSTHYSHVKALGPLLRSELPPHHRARFLVIRAHSQDQRIAILARGLIAGGGAKRLPLDHDFSAIIDLTSAPAAVSSIADAAGLNAASSRDWHPRLLD